MLKWNFDVDFSAWERFKNRLLWFSRTLRENENQDPVLVWLEDLIVAFLLVLAIFFGQNHCPVEKSFF